MSRIPKHIRDAINASEDAQCGKCGTKEADSYGQSVEYGWICHRCAFLELVGPGMESHPNCPPLPSDVRRETHGRGSSAAMAVASRRNVCSNCGAEGNDLKACSGTCGGSAMYCHGDCQKKHWRAVHKRECWKKADTDTFTIPHPKDGSKPPIKLKAYHQLDGYGKSGMNLTYSEEPGKEPKPYMIWCAATSPVADGADRSSLRPGEAVFNTTKHGVEVSALIRVGIIKDTGRKIKIGYYSPHPVCRINLPFHDEEEEYEEEDSEEEEEEYDDVD